MSLPGGGPGPRDHSRKPCVGHCVLRRQMSHPTARLQLGRPLGVTVTSRREALVQQLRVAWEATAPGAWAEFLEGSP